MDPIASTFTFCPHVYEFPRFPTRTPDQGSCAYVLQSLTPAPNLSRLAWIVQGLSFGVFGLGNKQYEHFCAVGKRVHKALANLGAHPLVRRGDGDDDEDIEADFESWRTELYATLDKSDVLAKSTVRYPLPTLQSSGLINQVTFYWGTLSIMQD
jgi:sulfite reductase alpha subunit-like flavoprotein